MNSVHCGILVGGLGSRMGGVAKGLLRARPDGPSLVERLRAELQRACPNCKIVLVGQRTEYSALGLPMLADTINGIGPLAGLEALLLDARRHSAEHALAVACDLPFVGAELLRRLCVESPASLALAPKQDGRWQPLCARYSVTEGLAVIDALRARGERALFRVLEELGATELLLGEAERAQLIDWDRPEDVSEQ
jgi:molybdenum cofactor guanylyltransferase